MARIEWMILKVILMKINTRMLVLDQEIITQRSIAHYRGQRKNMNINSLVLQKIDSKVQYSKGKIRMSRQILVLVLITFQRQKWKDIHLINSSYWIRLMKSRDCLIQIRMSLWSQDLDNTKWKRQLFQRKLIFRSKYNQPLVHQMLES